MSDSYQIVDIILPLETSEDEKARLKKVARKLRVKPDRIVEMRLQKHSIDARKAQILINLRLEVGIDQKLPDYVAPEPCYDSLEERMLLREDLISVRS